MFERNHCISYYFIWGGIGLWGAECSVRGLWERWCKYKYPRSTSENTVMTLCPFETHLILSMYPKLLLPLFVWNLISCKASPWCPSSHDLPGQLRTDAALLKYLLSTQVPMCFPNHSSLQLWKWALIHPRSMSCFNVSVETCARELFLLQTKSRPQTNPNGSLCGWAPSPAEQVTTWHILFKTHKHCLGQHHIPAGPFHPLHKVSHC